MRQNELYLGLDFLLVEPKKPNKVTINPLLKQSKVKFKKKNESFFSIAKNSWIFHFLLNFLGLTRSYTNEK